MVYKKELLQQIEKEVERAKAMVHSLLQFSKKKETKMETLSVKMLIDDTIKLLKGNIPVKVEVMADISEDIWVIADRQKMQHSLLNILKNSIDAISDEGKVSISARDDKNENIVEIKIQDTGLGIEPENIGRIFGPFFSTKEKGIGLGLFIANEFIKTQGGSLEVDSIVGKGTTFLIRLLVKES